MIIFVKEIGIQVSPLLRHLCFGEILKLSLIGLSFSNFYWTGIYVFNAICENKILAKTSEFTVL